MKREDYLGKRVICSYNSHGAGTVIGISRDFDSILVEFDNNIGGHDGQDSPLKAGRTGGMGHCWFCLLDSIKLEEEVVKEMEYAIY